MQQIHSILRSICSFLPNVSFLTPFITWLQERDLRFWAMLLMALTCVMWITVSDLFDEKDKNTSSNTNSRKSEKSVKREEENLLSFSSQTKSSNEKRGSVVDFASQMASQAATETSSNSSPSSPASPSTPNPTLRGVKSPLVASPGSVGSVGLTPPPRKGHLFCLVFLYLTVRMILILKYKYKLCSYFPIISLLLLKIDNQSNK